jgi:hypothetical protein
LVVLSWIFQTLAIVGSAIALYSQTCARGGHEKS